MGNCRGGGGEYSSLGLVNKKDFIYISCSNRKTKCCWGLAILVPLSFVCSFNLLRSFGCMSLCGVYGKT